MPFIPAKTPFLVKAFFKNYTWNIAHNKDKNVLYLTFDDGPTAQITEWTLDILKDYNAKATFFCIGTNIEKHPEIFNRIISEGHSIGNHTQNHLKGWKTNTKKYLSNVEQAQNTIAAHCSQPQASSSNLFRPPYGQITPKQGNALIKLGYKIIMWSVLSFDWEQNISKETCVKNVLKNTKNGSIIVFHDSVKASKNMQYALPKVLEYYRKKGFLFKQIPE
jgi:peptidoglycan/xylan/chitin deacetylase (PgdA/CDA1 family)